jgi:O-antigen/teichoic acid export membrane protein
MASELKRGAIRVVSNYTRMFLLLIVGIIFVPIFISGVGQEAYGLFGLLASTMGIAEMLNSVVRQSMLRELGAAYHSSEPNDFRNAYNAAIALCSALAVVTVAIFVGVYFLLPLLAIPDHLRTAAGWLLATQGLLSTCIILLGPHYNMLQVTERLVLFNTLGTISRSADLVTAVVLFHIIGVTDASTGVITFAAIAATTSIGVLLFGAVYMKRKESSMVMDFSRMTRSNIKALLPTAGWNGVVVTAINLHIRVDQIIMNLFFGLLGNTAFTLAVKLTSYVRLLAFGGTSGLDVVSARLSTKEQGMSVAQLLHHATRMHAVLALPAGLLVFLIAEPLMTLWVGRSVEDPQTLTNAIILAKILVIGMTARGISDCWTSILYGAGFIRSYAPLVMLGGICNPVIAIVLIKLLPEHIAYQGPAIAYSAIFTVVHFMIIPLVTARCLNVLFSTILLPLLKPTIITAISGSMLLIPHVLGNTESISILLSSIVCFGALHALLVWYIAINRAERARFANIFERKVGVVLPAWTRV